MTLYRIKLFEWVKENDEVTSLRGSPFTVYQVHGGRKRAYNLKENNTVFYILQHVPLNEAKARAEQLWTERLLAALEEVKP